MPLYSYLFASLSCPYCGQELESLYNGRPICIGFQWGYSEFRFPDDQNTYHLNDEIRWRRCPDGSILPDAFFVEDQGANMGSPDIKRIFMTDSASEFRLTGFPCPHCRRPMGGAVVEIAANRIVNAWVYPVGEFPDEHYCFERVGDRYHPQKDREDRQDVLVNCDCRPAEV